MAILIFILMKQVFFCLLVTTILLGCSGGSNLKRVLVFSRGTATIDKDAKTITVTSGTSSEEQTVDFDTKDKVTLQINSQAGKATVDLDSPGYYVINTKPDTIVGSYQLYGAPPTETKTYTQDFLKQQLDSLQKLIKDSNVTAANRNYFILPNHAVKVTDNTDAFIVGPFHKMTSIQQEGNKEPEVYRFYMVSEIRETIDHLKQVTTAPPSPNQ
jgi:hypothetical protein